MVLDSILLSEPPFLLSGGRHRSAKSARPAAVASELVAARAWQSSGRYIDTFMSSKYLLLFVLSC